MTVQPVEHTRPKQDTDEITMLPEMLAFLRATVVNKVAGETGRVIARQGRVLQPALHPGPHDREDRPPLRPRAVLDLGAVRLQGRRETGFRVYADPAGHPFCLVFGRKHE
jgi:hypothetical protein